MTSERTMIALPLTPTCFRRCVSAFHCSLDSPALTDLAGPVKTSRPEPGSQVAERRPGAEQNEDRNRGDHREPFPASRIVVQLFQTLVEQLMMVLLCGPDPLGPAAALPLRDTPPELPPTWNQRVWPGVSRIIVVFERKHMQFRHPLRAAARRQARNH